MLLALPFKSSSLLMRKYLLVQKIHATAGIFFFIVISANAAFSINEYLRLYVVATLILFFSTLLVIFHSRQLQGSFRSFYPEDLLGLLLVIFVILSGVLNPNEKTLNYVAVYFFLMGTVIVVKILLSHYGTAKVLTWNLVGVFVICVYVVVDFLLFHFFTFDIRELIPRVGPTPNATVSGVFRRSYGLSNEPTNLAAYFISLGFLAAFWSGVVLSKMKNLIFKLFFFLAFLTAFSGGAVAALIIAFPISIFISALFLNNKVTMSLGRIGKFLLISVSLIGLVFFIFKDALVVVSSKVLFQDSSFGSGRGQLWIDAISLLDSEFPILGFGPGYLSSIDFSVINSYLLFTLENGIFFISFLFLFFFFVSLRAIRVGYKYSWSIFFALVASVIQLNAFSTFYYPFIFVLLCIIQSFDSNDGVNGKIRESL